jgi:hypothetical protein
MSAESERDELAEYVMKNMGDNGDLHAIGFAMTRGARAPRLKLSEYDLALLRDMGFKPEEFPALKTD